MKTRHRNKKRFIHCGDKYLTFCSSCEGTGINNYYQHNRIYSLTWKDGSERDGFLRVLKCWEV